MRKTVLILTLLLIWSATSNANSSRSNPVRDGSATCADCSAKKDSTVEQLRGIRNSISGNTSSLEIYNYNLNRGEDLNLHCSNFVTDKGPGPWGKKILQTLNPELQPYLFAGTDDLERACPGYDSLEDKEKKYIWLAIINVMAIGESTCGLFQSAQGPNGRLVGIIHLHSGMEHQYSQGCNRGDGRRPESTFRCTLAMMDDQLRRDGALFSRRSYWDVLRPQAASQKYREIAKVLKGLSVCR